MRRWVEREQKLLSHNVVTIGHKRLIRIVIKKIKKICRPRVVPSLVQFSSVFSLVVELSNKCGMTEISNDMTQASSLMSSPVWGLLLPVGFQAVVWSL